MKKLVLIVIATLLFNLAKSQPVFKDVAGIIYSRCGSCHHENQHASSFMSYSEIVPHAYLMSTYLASGYMPPWSPDTTFSRFSHERLISPAEKAAILDWINNGTLPGDTTLAPPAPSYPQYKLYGTPDMVLQIPTFASNAGASDSYVCFSLPTGLTQDRILQAYEIVAGNESIVHHVIVNVDSLGTTVSDLSGTCYNATGDFSLGGYAPGAPPTVFPSVGQMKMGIRVKAGSKIVLQIHYPQGTAGLLDSTKIRLYFYPLGTTGVRPVIVSTPLQNWSMVIPANTTKTYTATYPSGAATLPSALSVFAAFPHSHKIATSLVNYAYAGIDTIPLIRINDWNFNWQGYYTFKKLVKVPAGYKLFSSHFYDNTTANPRNPSSPPVAVHAGLNTTDEMLFDSFQYLNYLPGDENINIDSLLAFDPLLTGLPQIEVSPTSFESHAYPNPFHSSTTIEFTPTNTSLQLIIYNQLGEVVWNEKISSGDAVAGFITWNGKDNQKSRVKSGFYFYELKDNKKKSSGKLLLMD